MEDFDGQWLGAAELRSMAAEVPIFSGAASERAPVWRRFGRRLRRIAKGAAYLSAAGVLFLWVVDPCHGR